MRVVQTGRRFQPSALHLEELAADGERRTDHTQPYEVEQQQHLLDKGLSNQINVGRLFLLYITVHMFED